MSVGPVVTNEPSLETNPNLANVPAGPVPGTIDKNGAWKHVCGNCTLATDGLTPGTTLEKTFCVSFPNDPSLFPAGGTVSAVVMDDDGNAYSCTTPSPSVATTNPFTTSMAISLATTVAAWPATVMVTILVDFSTLPGPSKT